MTTVTDIEYQADGRTMIGRLAVPDGEGEHPAVLIAHEGPGLDEHQRRRADQLAELGYMAFALDYQGGGVSMTDREAMMARLDELWHDPERTRELARAGLMYWVVIDDTLIRRWGPKVFGAFWTHDGSAQDPNALGRGNRWVILGIVVLLPFCSHPVCLPVLLRLWRGSGAARAPTPRCGWPVS